MEMSNSFGIPELHVAQQRRRDKLRFQQFDELQQANSNFHHHHHRLTNNNSNRNSNSNNDDDDDSTSVTVASSMMLLSPEMFNFSSNHPLPNIHPTRFVTPSRSDSCDPHPHPGWVGVGVGVPSFGINNSDQVSFDNGDQSGVHNWGNSISSNNNNNNNNELPLLPGNFVGHHPLNDTTISSSYATPRHGRGLSLSLSSNQLYQQMGEPQPQQELKPFELVNMSSSVIMKLESGSNSSSHHVEQGVSGSSIQLHNNNRSSNHVGPLGPFTGYAAILKSSKFLKPAQTLLDELFGGVWRVGDDSDNNDFNSRSHGFIGDCSTAMGSKIRGSSGGSCQESYIMPPDCYERKVKLLHMQEEVSKRQKQYHQQMQMVLSAFDSVPGLSSATPYISRSLKTISRHFRCLKNAIADQLKYVKRALGEDLSSPVNFLRGDGSGSLRSDQNFAKVKSGAVGGTSHVWRPQRGLPENAVSVLRAWLFDHFLHPYPTDNDKQMLANQTGLTRNQVSNWFINARVRLWKPMVEEIHTLETKASPRSEPSSSNSAMSAAIVKSRPVAAAANNKFSSCKPPLSPACDSRQLECPGPLIPLERSRGHETSTEQLFHKCSRIETNHQVPGSMDNSFISFLPYQRRGLDLGEIGVVSLTLGLKHGSDTTQQQLQHQFIPQGVPFGSHVIHDFSG